GLRLVEMNEMAGALIDLDVGVRHKLAPHLGLLDGYELVLIAPDDHGWHLDPVQIAHEFRIAWVLPEEPRERRRLAIPLADEVEIGLLRQLLLQHVEVRHQHRDELIARHREQIDHRILRIDHAYGRDEHELLDAMTLLRSEHR